VTSITTSAVRSDIDNCINH